MVNAQISCGSEYLPSGRLGWQAVPVLLLGCVAAAVSGWAYAAALVHLPFVLNLFVLCLFAAWLGRLTMWVCRLGKVRNADWMWRAATVVALLGWYSQWGAWNVLMYHELAGKVVSWELFMLEYADTLIRPWRMISSAVELSNLADARLDGWRIGGYWIVPLWGLEFLIIRGVSRACGKSAAAMPFCEKSGSWAVRHTLRQRFSRVDDGRMIKSMIRVNPAAIAVLFQPLPPDSESGFADVTIHRCRAGDAYLTVSDRGWLGPAKLELNMREKVHQERLTGVDVDALTGALERRAAQPPAVEMADDHRQQSPRELSFARSRLQAADHALALSLATPHLRSEKPEVRRDAARVCALAAGGAGRWDEARAHWLAVFEDKPGAQPAFQLAISSVMAGDVDQGAVWFDTADLFYDCEENGDPPWPSMLLSMLTALRHHGDMRASIRYVQELRDCFARCCTTDPADEFMEDMPLFGDFLNDSLPIVRAALPEAEWRAWYEAISDDLDDAGRRQLHAWLDAQLAPAA